MEPLQGQVTKSTRSDVQLLFRSLSPSDLFHFYCLLKHLCEIISLDEIVLVLYETFTPTFPSLTFHFRKHEKEFGRHHVYLHH